MKYFKFTHNVFIIFIACVVSADNLQAQFSILQDGNRETSYQLFNNQVIGINTQSESIGISITPTDKSKWDWTIISTLRAKNGVSNIIKNGEFQFSGNLGVNVIVNKSADSDNIIHNFYGVNLIYDRLNVFDSLKEFDAQIESKLDIGFRADLGWNFINVFFENLAFLGEFTSGISVSGGIKNNSELLDQIEIVTEISEIENGDFPRFITTRESVYPADQLLENRFFGRLNIDFGKFSKSKKFFYNFHLTYAIDNNLPSVLNPSIGIFLMENGAPLNAVLGLQLQNNDLFDSRNSSKTILERSTLVITAGFPFS